MRKNRSALLFLLVFFFGMSHAQIAPYDTVQKKGEKNYLLPIFRKKIKEKGYKMPASAGLGVNYFHQKSDIVVDNLTVGFNNSPMYNMQDNVEFYNTTAETNLGNVRGDVWLFPFLNVYGIFSRGKNRTNINAKIVVPTVNGNTQEILDFSVHPEFDVTSSGVGVNPIIGGKHWFVAFNTTFTWADISSMEKPVFSVVFNPRIGTNINFEKKDMSLAVWGGGFRLALSNETVGTLNMTDIADFTTFKTRVENGVTQLDVVYTNFQTWWNNLTPLQQANPINSKKYELGMAAINKASEVLNSVGTATENLQNSTIHYTLDKRQKEKWNFMIGAQFQLNKHFNIKAEYGFLGTRKHVLTGLEYRFDL